MRAILMLAVPAVVVILAAASPAIGCDYNQCTPTTVTIFELVLGGTVSSVPFPTRRGKFISHFDDGGMPHSIVTPVESHVNEVVMEVPCQTEEVF